MSWIYWALQLGEASKLSVVFVVLFATLFLGERLTVGTFAGVALMTAGAVVLAIQ